jgi:hypothetical protein
VTDLTKADVKATRDRAEGPFAPLAPVAAAPIALPRPAIARPRLAVVTAPAHVNVDLVAEEPVAVIEHDGQFALAIEPADHPFHNHIVLSDIILPAALLFGPHGVGDEHTTTCDTFAFTEDGTGLHEESGQLGGAGDGSFNVICTFPVHYN